MKYNAEIVKKWFAEHDIIAIPEYKFDLDRKWRSIVWMPKYSQVQQG